MYFHIFPYKDATIYEYSQSLNTGIDPILEVEKKVVSSSLYNSRALIAFNLSSISSSISSGTITNPHFDLILYSAGASSINPDYSLYAFPVSESWQMGTGRKDNYPMTTNGVSWIYKSTVNVRWATGSYGFNATGSWTSEEGGGTWFTSSAASQSFTYRENNDVAMDVTSIVRQWLSGSIPNNGFILKRSDSDEQSYTEEGRLQFFGVETNTIFVPSLRVGWDDSSYSTGTLQPFVLEGGVIYFKNIQPSYKETSKQKIRLTGRPKYPTRSFSTSSNYLVNYYLPSTSYYSVVDEVTNTTVIPFHETYTKISCDSTSNFFNFWFDSLFPERNYRFVIKVVKDGEERLYDNGFTFKVVK